MVTVIALPLPLPFALPDCCFASSHVGFRSFDWKFPSLVGCFPVCVRQDRALVVDLGRLRLKSKLLDTLASGETLKVGGFCFLLEYCKNRRQGTQKGILGKCHAHKSWFCAVFVCLSV